MVEIPKEMQGVVTDHPEGLKNSPDKWERAKGTVEAIKGAAVLSKEMDMPVKSLDLGPESDQDKIDLARRDVSAAVEADYQERLRQSETNRYAKKVESGKQKEAKRNKLLVRVGLPLASLGLAAASFLGIKGNSSESSHLRNDKDTGNNEFVMPNEEASVNAQKNLENNNVAGLDAITTDSEASGVNKTLQDNLANGTDGEGRVDYEDK